MRFAGWGLCVVTAGAVSLAAFAGGTLPEEFRWVERFVKYPGNPILRPQGEWAADLIFNPAAVVKDGRVGLLCRGVNLKERAKAPCWSVSSLIWAWSDDGINFTLDKRPLLHPDAESPYIGGFEDPRIVFVEDAGLYVLTYTGVKGQFPDGRWDTPALIAWSRDLQSWEFGGEAFPSRAVCIVPRRINGRYWAYWGNHDLGLSWSDDLRAWHQADRKPVNPRPDKFDSDLCEGVAAPIVGESGLLLLYNGAMSGRQAYDYARQRTKIYANVSPVVYQIGWALMDRNDPRRMIARCEDPVLGPEEPYERFGFINYTCFASGLVKFRGKWMLYYGCCDTRIGLATAPATK